MSKLTFYWTTSCLVKLREKGNYALSSRQTTGVGLVVEKFLGDYAGYVHCDMWSAYRQLDKAQLVGCWAHVRRKFFGATPKKTDKTSLGAKGLAYCDRLFTLENGWADLSTEERLHKRQTELAPLMDEFFGWCRNQSPFARLPNWAPAIGMASKYETTFRTVLSDGDLVLSNNIAERAMKTLVMGRKNWLFSQSFEGAKSTSVILSLLETAKRHGLDVEKYMTYLLEHLPSEETLAKKEVLEACCAMGQKH